MKIVNKNSKKLLTLVLSVSMVLLSAGSAIAAGAPDPVALGAAGNYTILAKTAISSVPNSNITGDIGISPNSSKSMTGFGLTADASGVFSQSSQVTGKAYASDYISPTPSNLTTAVSNMETAYTDAAGRPADKTELYDGDISGRTLTTGVYKWGTDVSINKDVTLNGGADDVFIFQVAKGITQASGTKIILTGGAQAKNIIWQAADTVAIGTDAHFEGTVLGMTNITSGNNASINGRLLAQTAVTLINSTVVAPPLVVSPTASQIAVTAAVVKASGSKLKVDVDAAKLLVNALPADVDPETYKKDLLARIAAIEVPSTPTPTAAPTAAPTPTPTPVVPTTVTGGQLPNTSTPLYDLLMIGGAALTLVGAMGWKSRKRFI